MKFVGPVDPGPLRSPRRAELSEGHTVIFFGEGTRISYVSRIGIVVIIEKIELMKGGHILSRCYYVTCTLKTKVYLQCQISFLTRCNPDFQLFLAGLISFASVAGCQETEGASAPPTLGCFRGTKCFFNLDIGDLSGFG